MQKRSGLALQSEPADDLSRVRGKFEDDDDSFVLTIIQHKSSGEFSFSNLRSGDIFHNDEQFVDLLTKTLCRYIYMLCLFPSQTCTSLHTRISYLLIDFINHHEISHHLSVLIDSTPWEILLVFRSLPIQISDQEE